MTMTFSLHENLDISAVENCLQIGSASDKKKFEDVHLLPRNFKYRASKTLPNARASINCWQNLRRSLARRSLRVAPVRGKQRWQLISPVNTNRSRGIRSNPPIAAGMFFPVICRRVLTRRGLN